MTKLSPRRLKTFATLAFLAGQLFMLPAWSDPADLKPFRANYTVEWKSLTAGRAILELKAAGPARWEYSNVNTPRGIFRMALPDSISQISTFEISNGKIRPLTFRGTDEKERAIDLHFEWVSKRVTGSAKGHAVDLAVNEDTQDPMSLQIASLRGLAGGSLAGTVWMIDGDKLKEYVLSQEGQASIDTELGRLDTLIYVSRARGGDRVTRTWVAPALGYLPVKAERLRKDKLEFALKIESVER